MDPNSQAKREYAQLLRLHERLLTQLQRISDELVAPGTKTLLREIKARTGNPADSQLQEVTGKVEEAVRALKMSESKVQEQLIEDADQLTIEGVPNLPAHLARFLAERAELEGFSYTVGHDEERGWVIAWKEYTHRGTIRGYGQFYERPYAWLDD